MKDRAQYADDCVIQARRSALPDQAAGGCFRRGNASLAGRPIRRALVLMADSPRRKRRAIFADDTPAAQRLRSSSRSASVHGRTSGRRAMDSFNHRRRIGSTERHAGLPRDQRRSTSERWPPGQTERGGSGVDRTFSLSQFKSDACDGPTLKPHTGKPRIHPRSPPTREKPSHTSLHRSRSQNDVELSRFQRWFNRPLIWTTGGRAIISLQREGSLAAVVWRRAHQEALGADGARSDRYVFHRRFGPLPALRAHTFTSSAGM